MSNIPNAPSFSALLWHSDGASALAVGSGMVSSHQLHGCPTWIFPLGWTKFGGTTLVFAWMNCHSVKTNDVPLFLTPQSQGCPTPGTIVDTEVSADTGEENCVYALAGVGLSAILKRIECYVFIYVLCQFLFGHTLPRFTEQNTDKLCLVRPCHQHIENQPGGVCY